MEGWSGIVILAAGSSSRLGRPKQLLAYKDGSLLEHTVAQALASVAGRVVVVLGANESSIVRALDAERLSFIINHNWQEGMASSIRAGLQALLQEAPGLERVLFMTCDQPFVDPALLDKLVSLQMETGKPITASEYGGTVGIPAVFAASIFPELLELTGDSGAKKIMLQQQGRLLSVPFPLGNIDIDTAADYAQLIKK